MTSLPEKLVDDLSHQFSTSLEPYVFKKSEISEVEKDYKETELKQKKGKKTATKKKKKEIKKKTDKEK